MGDAAWQPVEELLQKCWEKEGDIVQALETVHAYAEELDTGMDNGGRIHGRDERNGNGMLIDMLTSIKDKTGKEKQKPIPQMHPKQEQQEQKTKNYSNIDSVLAFLTGPAARHGGQSRGSDDIITQQRILRAQEILKYGREELKQDLEKLGNMMDQQIVCNRIETMRLSDTEQQTRMSSDTEQQTRISSDTEQQTRMSSDTNHGEENSFIHAAILCAAQYDVLQENYDVLEAVCGAVNITGQTDELEAYATVARLLHVHPSSCAFAKES